MKKWVSNKMGSNRAPERVFDGPEGSEALFNRELEREESMEVRSRRRIAEVDRMLIEKYRGEEIAA